MGRMIEQAKSTAATVTDRENLNKSVILFSLIPRPLLTPPFLIR
jgi:hypothetical protein